MSENPSALSQMVIELKSTAEKPKPIDEIPGSSMEGLLENPKKALGKSVSICQGLGICSGSHRKLEAALEQAKKSKSGAPEVLGMYKDLAPRVQEIYKCIIAEIEEMSRKHARLIRELENIRVDQRPGGPWQQEQEQRPY